MFEHILVGGGMRVRIDVRGVGGTRRREGVRVPGNLILTGGVRWNRIMIGRMGGSLNLDEFRVLWAWLFIFHHSITQSDFLISYNW